MNLQLLLTLLTLLAAAIAAWAALRPRQDPGLETLQRQLNDEIGRSRRDSQADLVTQLGPLRDQLTGLGQSLAASKAEQQKALAEGLADRFRELAKDLQAALTLGRDCLLYTSPSPRDGLLSRMPSSA